MVFRMRVKDKSMSWLRKLVLAAPLLLLLHACGGDDEAAAPIVVDFVEDSATPATGKVTLRSALASAASARPSTSRPRWTAPPSH